MTASCHGTTTGTPGECFAEKRTVNIGIIGFGDMGRLYAQKFIEAGWQHVNVCDLPAKYDALREELADSPIRVFRDGHAVSRRSDFIIYSVEAERINAVVALYAPSTKMGAIVAGQTSVKAPEVRAFEEHMPEDVNIVTCHSLHGPKIDPTGQPLVIVRHRSTEDKYHLTVRILSSLGSEHVFLSYEEHDRITADTQAVTHVAFLSMGTAWKTQRVFPWEDRNYVGGIENVKVNMALRIYGSKWHVYAGLAILNPSARIQVRQYALSVSELFALMIQERKEEFRARILRAADYVFGQAGEQRQRSRKILLSDEVLDRFSLSSVPKEKRKPNSHLSLLAIVDCWHALRINPYDHLICQTPPFRLWVGIVEYLFNDAEMLESTINAALYDMDTRGEDLHFYSAAQGWAQCIEIGSMEGYQLRFQDTSSFFQDRLADAGKLSSEMIATITRHIHQTD
ncbi:hypothetical protein THASP1DRAFT_31327 [Thamnocephalis sphaerospora]|uniref:Prephenate dehydrogenase [NADP(+)] n=1 Tax=Thamnocephalis sphaerospora TaxID=78915 RepID=A0A4P9XLU9_9FUNG|nr:hypothetical protein THASP1DRAFT_31327 [Thamnocephalis sphaerospora]|eukprot:RKP06863.1 hypothetical protein THASP1DRAFT_31327 [Thamnocephalis sphaerospora]